ncbi:SIS domain-containing protein [Streptomyces sp. SCSIO ZS0520]|uniref:SIS domain-containing protein n=1 Tax=Streptomyces sp. SCSIO ZS0520 TaxID=2892996 RepID=UPI0021D8B00D|nr:SIS domain-containing protein [Streptomyces sp. SCSIO ZS0520]
MSAVGTDGDARGERAAPAPGGGLAEAYLDATLHLLARQREQEAESGRIGTAAALIADTVAAGGRLFAFGAGHSSLLAQDLVYRAGGLALVNLLPVPGARGVESPATLGSALEHVEGLATAVLDTSPVTEGDLLLVISLSGRNTLPVEMAMEARARGLRTLGVTSLAYVAATTARHASGTRLVDHCDAVLDTGVPVGDAQLTAEGIDAPFAPVSTPVTSALLHAVFAAAAGELARRGAEVPLLRSGNVDGGIEWNERVFATYGDRIFYR